MTPRRVATTILLPLAVLIAIVLPALLLADRLPSPLATHWNGSGQPDGRTDGGIFFGVIVAVWLGAWAALLLGARRDERQFAAPWVLGLGGFLVGIAGLTVIANLDAAAWADADELSLLAALGPISLALLLVAIAWRLEWSVPVSPVVRPSSPPSTTTLQPGERFFWSGSAQASWWFPVALGVIGMTSAAAAFLSGAPTALLLAIGVAVPLLALWTSRTRLTVTPAGVQARLGARIPRRIVPVETIVAAEAIDVVPLQWGGWGWRVTPKATGLIVRRGEGVRLQLTSGRDLVVTIDDAGTAASLINELVRRGDH